MNRDIVKKLFPKMLERLDQGLCTWCEEPIWIADFEDELSMKEYKISGLCQDCQNKTFGKCKPKCKLHDHS